MRLYSCALLLMICSLLNGQSARQPAGVLFGKYLVAKDSGDFLKAETFLDEILLLSDELPPYNLSLIYNGLGTVNYSLGRYQDAEINYDKARLLCTGSDSDSRALLAQILNNQAMLHKQVGEYFLSLEHYQQSEEVLKQINRHDKQYYDQLSMIYFNRGLVRYKLQQFQEAIDLFREALELRYKNDLPYLGTIHFNLARCYAEMQNGTLAREYFHRSMEQWIEDYDSCFYELGNVYLEYGEFLVSQGDFKDGLDYYFKALDIYLVNYGENHTYTASCYNLIGDFYRDRQAYQESLEYLQHALISICPGFISENVYSNPDGKEGLLDTRLLRIYRSKIRTLVEAADPVLLPKDSLINVLNFALGTSKEAVNVLHRIREGYLTQESRLYLDGNQKDIFFGGIEIALMLHRHTGDPRFLEEAYGFAAAGKTAELSFEMQEKNLLYLASLEDSASKALLDLKSDIDAYSNLIEMELVENNPDSLKISNWRGERFKSRNTHESLYEELLDNPVRNDRGMPDPGKGSLRDLQSMLHRKETVIEYSVSNSDMEGNAKLVAFVISKNDCQYYQTVLDPDFSQNMATLNSHLEDYEPLSADLPSEDRLEQSLSELYMALIKPIEQWVKGTRLVIIPDGEIARIPFDALRKEDGKNYLIRDFEISYAPNSSLVSNHRQTLFGRNPKVRVIARDYAAGTEVDDGGEFLSSVSSEAAYLLKELKGRRIPADLSKREVLQEIEGGELLHFALHTSPSDTLLSSACMRISNQQDTIYQDLLFDYEIDPLQLSARLVVINTCESGSGTLYNSEGMLSLSRSFLLGGAESVVHTLWPVDDRAGYRIIQEFYKGISRGWNKSRSLRNAKLKYLAESSPSFSIPYYWAGYQLVGNTGAIILPRKEIITGLLVILIISSIVVIGVRRKRK